MEGRKEAEWFGAGGLSGLQEGQAAVEGVSRAVTICTLGSSGEQTGEGLCSPKTPVWPPGPPPERPAGPAPGLLLK
jgi:hypothetical protein